MASLVVGPFAGKQACINWTV
ncbi:uncharacterized protein G2W53_031009 [Senna tora]|uniref:Uncharacterized protein n=1 Tax=Senna tora TaxID=362788 RepID=A0A834WBB7_9FABA|nr:uncharacterized protein G2W53_031009 [Senna tora]